MLTWIKLNKEIYIYIYIYVYMYQLIIRGPLRNRKLILRRRSERRTAPGRSPNPRNPGYGYDCRSLGGNILGQLLAVSESPEKKQVIGQDVCDMIPAWDPPEGISFSNEILWKLICVVFFRYSAFSEDFIHLKRKSPQGDLKQETCRKVVLRGRFLAPPSEVSILCYIT